MTTLENFVQKFLSLDHQLLPETILQIRLLEWWILLTIGIYLIFNVMRVVENAGPAFSTTFLKWALLVAICVNVFLLRIASPARGFETMEMYDGVHYTAGADRLIKEKSFSLPINEENHPVGKAPGFSLLIAPIYLFFPNNLGAAVFVPMILGLLSLFLLYRLSFRLAGEETALVALLLLGFSPLHIVYSRLIMPSMGPLFCILLATFSFTKKSAGFKTIFCAGVLLGFAGVIRYLAVAAIPATLVYLLTRQDDSSSLRAKKMAFLLLGAAFPLVWLFYFQWKEFGSAWLTGYSYWEFLSSNMQKPFSFTYAFGIPPSSGGSPNALFALISATGAHIPYPNILKSRPDQIIYAYLIGFFALRGLSDFYRQDRPFFYFIVLFFIGLYLPHALLFSQAGHFMLPIVPFILLATAKGIVAIFKKIPMRGLLIANLAFIPFAYTFSHQPFETNRRDFLQMIEKNVPQKNFFITDFDAILLTHLIGSPKQITTIALSDDILYADRLLYFHGKTLPPALWGATNHPDKIKTLLAKGERIYLSRFSKENFKKEYEKLSDAFDLKPVANFKNYRLYELKLSGSEKLMKE
ncbi:MAG: glycosyltransferase family 39 protein [Deltaproteobacteria bacterium]|nr:glycosyltransferase family 39 protein [Deltaproteobacteria bacterium]